MPDSALTLTQAQAAAVARLALDGIPREYPNKPGHVLTGPGWLRSPRALHPVFFGCFDWHSSVHGHWMLVRLAKDDPQAAVTAEIRTLLESQFTAEGLAEEAAYFDAKENQSFERMYGWAWALRLALELSTWNDPQARRWSEHLLPLESRLVELTMGYLPRLSYPIRTGVHPDTAFALGQMLDYARGVGNEVFESQLTSYALAKYRSDRNYPAAYEPSGEDFFSAGLNEADLLRRILGPEEFASWLGAFLPGLDASASGVANLLTPAEVTDVRDGKLVHLAGLNLSRAWCLRGIAGSLPEEDARREVLAAAAGKHFAAGLQYVFSGHYEGEHWLGTFAVYGVSDSRVR